MEFLHTGAWPIIVIGGFAVGDLVEHGIAGGLARALALGREWGGQGVPIGERIDAVDGRLLAIGRVRAVELHPGDLRVRTIDVAADDGAVVRVVARTETVACVVDGRVVARAPDIIDFADPQTGGVLLIEDIAVGRSVAVLALGAPAWWTARGDRLARVLPSHYGLDGLDRLDEVRA